MASYPDPTIPGDANGVTPGDDKNIPNKGTRRGFLDVGGGSYGADTDMQAQNRMGSIHGACKSDPMDECHPQGGGDQRAHDERGTHNGRAMGSATKSDAPADDVPNEQKG